MGCGQSSEDSGKKIIFPLEDATYKSEKNETESELDTSQEAPAWQGWVEQGLGCGLHTVSELGIRPGRQAQYRNTQADPSARQESASKISLLLAQAGRRNAATRK
jgi:hypothetical protein